MAKWVLAAVATVSLGVWAGVFLSSLNAQGVELVAQSESEVLVADHLEGEIVEVPLILRNHKQESITIEDVVTSCSCTEVVFENGRKVSGGDVVPPRGYKRLFAKIDTSGRSGISEFAVVCNLKSSDKPSTVRCLFSLKVIGTWRAIPDTISVQGLKNDQDSVHRITIVDGFDDQGRGIQIGRIEVSDPDQIDVQIDSSPSATTEHPSIEFARDRQLTPRHSLLIDISGDVPNQKRVQGDWVVLFPAEGNNCKPLRIPICTFREIAIS